MTVICIQLGVNQDTIANLDLDDIMQTEIDNKEGDRCERDEPPPHKLTAFDPEVSACIDAEKQSLLSPECLEPLSYMPIVERYEFPPSPLTKTTSKTHVAHSEDPCEIRLKQLKEKYEAVCNPVKHFAQHEIVGRQNLTFEFRCKKLLEMYETFLFPDLELAQLVPVECLDMSTDLALIPSQDDEHSVFYDRYKKGTMILFLRFFVSLAFNYRNIMKL